VLTFIKLILIPRNVIITVHNWMQNLMADRLQYDLCGTLHFLIRKWSDSLRLVNVAFTNESSTTIEFMIFF
jgi:hypothetical protein